MKWRRSSFTGILWVLSTGFLFSGCAARLVDTVGVLLAPDALENRQLLPFTPFGSLAELVARFLL